MAHAIAGDAESAKRALRRHLDEPAMLPAHLAGPGALVADVLGNTSTARLLARHYLDTGGGWVEPFERRALDRILIDVAASDQSREMTTGDVVALCRELVTKAVAPID